jgi:hypothetical protein
LYDGNTGAAAGRTYGKNRKFPAAFGVREFRIVHWLRSIFADVDGAQAIAIGGQDAAEHIATVVAISDEADADAEVVVMMVAPAAAPTAAPRLRGSRGGSQRHGAERSCGNQSKSEFA